jgi:choline-glycine betaine transporter
MKKWILCSIIVLFLLSACAGVQTGLAAASALALQRSKGAGIKE